MMYSKIAVDRIMGMADIEKTDTGLKALRGYKRHFGRKVPGFCMATEHIDQWRCTWYESPLPIGTMKRVESPVWILWNQDIHELSRGWLPWNRHREICII